MAKALYQLMNRPFSSNFHAVTKPIGPAPNIIALLFIFKCQDLIIHYWNISAILGELHIQVTSLEKSEVRELSFFAREVDKEGYR